MKFRTENSPNLLNIDSPVWDLPRKCSILIVFIGILTVFGSCAATHQEPAALFLTWTEDPATTMTIDWHTVPDHKGLSELRYKKEGTEEWSTAMANSHAFPHSDRQIHRVTLRGLDAATSYLFRAGEFTREYSFRTMPDNLNEPIRFITGGDTHYENHAMSATAIEFDPDFIVWGGDLAYADGDPGRLYYWYGWFDGIMENLVSENGRVVPIIVAIGNHEVFGANRLLQEGGRYPHPEMTESEAREFILKHDLRDGEATFFFDLFAFPGKPAYNTLDFGDYLTLIILDSGHTEDIDGKQTEWLETVLSERQNIPHVFPVYHVPAYPSYRSYEQSRSVEIRDHWVPLFEKYGVRVAFENHDHTYKRTFPIRNGRIHDAGIVYIGDGNWGRGFRNRDVSHMWYINKFDRYRRHGIVVTLHGTHQHFLMVDEFGEVFDEYPERPRQVDGAP